MKYGNFLLIITGIAISLNSYGQTITLQPDGNSGKDALIRISDNGATDGNTNFGTDQNHKASRTSVSSVWYKTRSLIQFDLSAIPRNATITSATLTLYGVNHSTAGQTNAGVLQRVYGNWDEQTVTWNNQPSSKVAGQVAIAASTSATQNFALDVKNSVQEMVQNPSGNFGWLIKLNGESTAATAELYFASSDNTTAASRPKLEITYLILGIKQTSATAHDQTDGAADLTVSGGTSPYTYSWTNSAGGVIATTQDISSLAAGYYAVTVTDAAGKVAYSSVVIGSRSTAATVNIQPSANFGKDAIFSFFETGVNVTSQDVNYGTHGNYNAYRWTNGGHWFKQRAAISYDLSSIPSHAIITDAKLYLYGLGHTPPAQSNQQSNASTLQRITTPWNEASVTWNTQPAVNATGAVTITQSTSTTQNYTLNVTSHVQDMVRNPEDNFGWMIKLNGESNNQYACLVFASSDYTTDATKRPKLEITFVIPYQEETRNWINAESFDNNGNVMAQSRTYIDALGRTTQQQSLDIANGNVLASQNVFDAFGRPSLQTLAAPLFQNGIYFKDGFIKDGSGNNYSYDDFDKPVTTSNLSGEVNNPGAVNSSTQGTLGWYYSNNNTAEPYVAASSFPYVRSEYYSDPLGRRKRSSAAGENHRAGSGHSQKAFYLRGAGELQYAYGYKGSYTVGFEGTQPDYIANENLTTYKTVTVDADGKENISYTNSSGKLVATCMSGVTTTCASQKIGQTMYYNGSRSADIHIPASKKDKLKLMISASASALAVYTDEGTGSHEQQVNYTITDIDKEKLLVDGTDYTINRSTRLVTFLGSYATGTSFLRISYQYTQLYLDQRFNPDYYTTLQKFYGASPGDLMVTYELDYSNWSLNYFDKKGLLVKTVSPQGLDCSYDPITNYTKTTSYVDKPIATASSCSTPTHVISTTPVANYDQALKINVRLFANGTICMDDYDGSEYGFSTLTSGSSSTTGTSAVSDDMLPDYSYMQLPVEAAQGETGGTRTLNIPPEDGVFVYSYRMGFDLCGLTSVMYYIGDAGTKKYQAFTTSFTASIDALTLRNVSSVGVRLLSITIVAYKYDGVSTTPVWDHEETYVYNTNAFWDNMFCPLKLGIISILEKFPIPNMINTALTSTNSYNGVNWPIKSITADEGAVNVIYNTEGRVRFIQNAQQLANGGKFTYINYDRAGRVIETGEYDPALTGGTLLVFQPYTTGGGVPSAPPSGTSVHAIINNMDWSAYAPRSTQQTYNNYDLAQSDFPGTLTGYSQNYKDGQLVKSWNGTGTSWYGYDDMSRPIWKVNSITGLGNKTINYIYTKEGQLDKMDYQKEISGERFVHQYVYDANKQMKETKTSFDNTTFSTNQALKYYLHGALKRNELGVTLQGLDYVYTINGQLKSVNDPGLTNRDPGKDSYTGVNSTFKKDVFGFTLDYFTNDYLRQNSLIETYTPSGGNTALTEQYSGLIRAMRWQTTLPTAAVGSSTYTSGMIQYAYKYDSKNQLSEAIFGTIAAGTINGSTSGTSPVFTEEVNAYRVNNVTYDKIGNIKTLKRQGKSTLLSMDDFTYNYNTTLPNRLTSIADIGSATNYTDDIKTQAANNYLYNSIGQLTKDVLADYNYTYNMHGNVATVKKTNGVHIAAFEYNEAGLRQKKTSYNAGGTATTQTWYVYDADGALLSTYETVVSTSVTTQTTLQIYGAGRLGVYDKINSNYIYELNDHLGNVRATVKLNGTNAEVLSFTDYYPHGSAMPGRNYISSPSYKFGYQGQEKDGETGFNNFELRQYDARIGRWFNPDPMGQYHSLYLAMGNNPISIIDPTGGWDWSITWENGKTHSQFGDYENKDVILGRDPYGLLDGPHGHFYESPGSDYPSEVFDRPDLTKEQEEAIAERAQELKAEWDKIQLATLERFYEKANLESKNAPEPPDETALRGPNIIPTNEGLLGFRFWDQGTGNWTTDRMRTNAISDRPRSGQYSNADNRIAMQGVTYSFGAPANRARLVKYVATTTLRPIAITENDFNSLTPAQRNAPNVHYFRYITGYDKPGGNFIYQYGYIDGSLNGGMPNMGTPFRDVNGQPFISNPSGGLVTFTTTLR